MKKVNVNVPVSESKLKIVRHYLNEKGLDLEKELEDSVQKIYEKHVPKESKYLLENVFAKPLPATKTRPKAADLANDAE